tara:strand:+ start:188 stop:391 length:204 start_codon:yes stop_codon:yes gene_type:complete
MTLLVNKVEIEVQKQEIKNKNESRWMTLLKYEPKESTSTEILSIVLSDSKPIVRHTVDNGSIIKENK